MIKLLVVLICLVFSAFSKAESFCNLSLDNIKNKAVGYRNRGNYCEGIYKEGYSSRSNIKLLGYHIAPVDFIKNLDDTAKITVASPVGELVHTVLHDTVLNTFYRRDQLIRGGQVVDWSLDVIKHSKVDISANELIGIGCLPKCFGGADIYFPINISSSGLGGKVDDHRVYLELPLSSQEVRVRLVDQKTKQVVFSQRENRPVETVRSFKEVPVNVIESFRLPKIKKTAYLEVDVLKKTPSGKEGIVSTSFLLGVAGGE